MNKNRVLRVAAFLDGSPGHEKQTRGILKCLQKRMPVEVDFISVKNTSMPQQVMDWLRFFLTITPLSADDGFEYDLMVGTGTHTHLPMLLQKKKKRIPVITCMAPSPLLINSFDLLFIPQHDNVAPRENIIMTLGPPNTCEDHGRHEEQRALILIGGVDPKSHIWNSTEIVNLIRQLLDSTPQRTYIISTSPRTPVETENEISSLCCSYRNVDFYKYKNTTPGWVEEEYNRCRYVWVTGDSISMVYEALTSGCKVGILPVNWKNPDSKIPRSNKYLQDNGRVMSLQSYLQGRVDWKESQSLNEAERCAAAIIERWV